MPGDPWAVKSQAAAAPPQDEWGVVAHTAAHRYTPEEVKAHFANYGPLQTSNPLVEFGQGILDVGKGLYRAATEPAPGTGKGALGGWIHPDMLIGGHLPANLLAAQIDQARQAWEAAKAGHGVEAGGHALSTITPGGPFAAGLGEMLPENPARAFGQASTLLIPKVAGKATEIATKPRPVGPPAPPGQPIHPLAKFLIRRLPGGKFATDLADLLSDEPQSPAVPASKPSIKRSQGTISSIPTPPPSTPPPSGPSPRMGTVTVAPTPPPSAPPAPTRGPSMRTNSGMPTAAPTATPAPAIDPLLDDIARGQANKPFSKLSPEQQAQVQNLANRLKPATPPPPGMATAATPEPAAPELHPRSQPNAPADINASIHQHARDLWGRGNEHANLKAFIRQNFPDYPENLSVKYIEKNLQPGEVMATDAQRIAINRALREASKKKVAPEIKYPWEE